MNKCVFGQQNKNNNTNNKAKKHPCQSLKSNPIHIAQSDALHLDRRDN